MDLLAAGHLKANPELGRDAFGRQKADGGRAAAYSAVLLHPDNRELAARVKAEDLAGRPRTAPGHAVQVEHARAANHEMMTRTRGP